MDPERLRQIRGGLGLSDETDAPSSVASASPSPTMNRLAEIRQGLGLDPPPEPVQRRERTPDLSLPGELYAHTNAAAEDRRHALEKGNWMDAAGAQLKASAWGALETATLPLGVGARAADAAIQTGIEKAEGREGKPFLQKMAESQSSLAAPIERLSEAAMRATTAMQGGDQAQRDADVQRFVKDDPTSRAAIAATGFYSDLVFDPLNKVKFLAPTKRAAITNIVRERAPGLGYKLDGGNLTKMVQTADGLAEYAAKPSEVIADLIKSSTGKQAKKLTELKKSAEAAEKFIKTLPTEADAGFASAFDPVFGRTMQAVPDPTKMSRMALQREGLVASSVLPGAVDKALATGLSRGRMESSAIQQAKPFVLRWRGISEIFSRKDQQAMSNLMESHPDYQAAWKESAAGGADIKPLDDEIRQLIEANPYQTGRKEVLKVADDPILPADWKRVKNRLDKGADIAPKDQDIAVHIQGAIQDIPFPNTTAGRVARSVRGALDSMQAAERAEGVGAKYRYGFSDEVEKVIQAAPDPEQVRVELHRLADRYPSPEEFEAARGIELHPLFKKQPVSQLELPGMKSPGGPDTSKVFNPATVRGYFPRVMAPETVEKIADLAPHLDIKTEAGRRLRDWIQKVSSGTGGTMARAKGAYQEERTLGKTASFEEVTARLGKFFEFDQQEAKAIEDTWKETLGLYGHSGQARKIKAALEEDGFFTPNWQQALSRRMAKGTAARSASRLGSDLAASGLVKTVGQVSKNPWLKEGKWGYSNLAQDTGTEAAIEGVTGKGTRLGEVVPGLKGPDADLLVHPDAANYLQAMHRNTTLMGQNATKIEKAAEYYIMSTTRKMLLAKPVTAVRNFLDSNYKNLVVYGGGDYLTGATLASAAMRHLKPIEMTMPVKTGTQLERITVGAGRRLIDDVAPQLTDRVMDMDDIVTHAGERLSLTAIADEARRYGVVLDANQSNSFGMQMGKGRDAVSLAEEAGKAARGGLLDKVGLLAKKTGREATRLPDITLRLSSSAENHARLTSFIIERMRGATPVEAALRSHGVHWTSALPDDIPARLIASKGRESGTKLANAYEIWSRFGATFWFFQRHNYPFWVKTMLAHPGRASAPVKFRNFYDRKNPDAAPPEEFRSQNMKASPYFQGIGWEMNPKTGELEAVVQYKNYRSFSPMDVLSPGAQRASNLVMPFWQLLWGLGESAKSGEGIKDPYYGKELRGADAVEYAARQIVPVLGWLRRPAEAMAPGLVEKLGLTDRYPEESLMKALTETFISPIRTTKEKVKWLEKSAPDIKRIRKRLHELDQKDESEEGLTPAEDKEYDDLWDERERLESAFEEWLNAAESKAERQQKN